MENELIIDQPAEKLPFDIKTILIGLWRRKFLLVGICVASIPLGILGGLQFGNRVYEAETVLLYKPEADLTDPNSQSPSLLTQMNMVKIQTNLEEARRRLQLPVTLQSLGAASGVRVQRDTDLMIIRSSWATPREAANLANTLREVFLETQSSLRKEQVARQIVDLSDRLRQVELVLTEADAALQQFTTENQVVDLDKEAQWYLDQLTELELLYEQAQIEKRSTELKIANLDRIVNDLQAKAAAESSAQGESLGDANIRLGRLRTAIHDDRELRSNKAQLEQKQAKFIQAQELYEQGLISDLEFRDAMASLESQKALTQDTDQIREWREEIDRLDKAVIPTKDSTPSGRLMQEMQLKSFNIQLDGVAVQEKAQQLEQALGKVRVKLDALPALQRRFVELRREVMARESEKEELEQLIAKAKRAHDSDKSDYLLVSEAAIPTVPVESSRRILALAIAAFGSCAGFGLVLSLELVDTRIKSPSELQLKLNVPVIGNLPEANPLNTLILEEDGSEDIESFRIMGRAIRNSVPEKGARILFVGAHDNVGVSSLIANLATNFARQEERVIAIDAQLRGSSVGPGLTELLLGKEKPDQGLGDCLSDPNCSLKKEAVHSTPYEGLTCLPRTDRATSPDKLASSRMASLLDSTSNNYDLVLIDSAPALQYVDAQSLAQWSDAIVFVVKAGTSRVPELRKVVDRLNTTGTPVIGAIMSDVDPVFLSS
jgi:Mrp family chromosome partitioning ATPase